MKKGSKEKKIISDIGGRGQIKREGIKTKKEEKKENKERINEWIKKSRTAT